MFYGFVRKAFDDPYSSASLIRRLVQDHAIGQWPAYGFAVAMMIVAAACSAAAAYLVGHAVNDAYVHRDLSAVIAVCLGIVAVTTLRGFASYGQAVEMGRISNRIVAANQNRLFEKIIRQGLPFFANRHSSEFSGRIIWGARAASDTLNLLITGVCRDATQLVGLFGVMIWQSPLLALMSCVVVPPAFLIGSLAIKRVRAISRAQFGSSTDILEVMQECVQGFKVVEAFNLQSLMRHRINESIGRIEAVSNDLARASNFSGPFMESLGGSIIGLVTLFGGYQVIVFNTPPGVYFAFITAFLLAYEPARRLARMNVDLTNALTGVRILFEFLDLPERAEDIYKPPLHVDKGRIAFANVEFGYRPNMPVLCGVSFAAEPGRVTALVGPSGGGKSTIFNLLLRFYEDYRGSITIDGTEVAGVSRESLRDHLAFVGQDTFLFRGSVRDNIALGSPEATDDDVVAAAKAAHADAFIRRLPAGYDTLVGEHGMQLSGGERQRVAVARALIRKSSIILLDEPTSFLDSETESYVNWAITELFGGRTRLIIAHRLHTIVNADQIWVVENGRVVESGRHRGLLDRDGRYARFFNLQHGREKELQVL
jgi:ABC-type multidrug transport system fused ATPase/permease subunit